MSKSRTPTTRPRRHAFVAGTAMAAAVLAQGAAQAAPDEREQCATSAEQAQQMRDEGKYRRAREQMLFCARETCPGPIKSDCSKWLSELDRDAPTVVFGARDSKGSDVLDVSVSMDGAVIQDQHRQPPPVVVDGAGHDGHAETQRVRDQVQPEARHADECGQRHSGRQIGRPE